MPEQPGESRTPTSEDADGCPHEVSDRDRRRHPGRASTSARTRAERVIKNPKSPYYGCPDRDGDGIPDKIDKCPDEPEDFDGFEDADGCPDPDNDHDGIPDELDECINEPENYNGYQDADGCPDTPPNGPAKLVDVTATEIKILETVEFDTAKATIKGARSLFPDPRPPVCFGDEEPQGDRARRDRGPRR